MKKKARPAKARRAEKQPAVIYTVGHSTRSFDELVELLRAHGVERLADVRTVPRSRTNPQFNRDTFGPGLRNRRIAYRHMQDLGGLRRARPDSVNTGWRNASFRGYADYMQTDEFRAALDELVRLAEEKTTAIMCAEAVPWRCHRRLITDALLARGVSVADILNPGEARPAALSPHAVVREDGTVIYPATPQGDLFAG